MENNKIIGILGGGQLGRMLIQQGINYGIITYVLDKDPNASCSTICNKFILGDLLDFETVYQFGKMVDKLTIEIEHVNVDALLKLKSEGLTIIPDPDAIKIIQDKGLQKLFYKANNIPTADFILLNNKSEIKKHEHFLPAFQKMRRFGYDGKGVTRINNLENLTNAFDCESYLEKAFDFEKEISVIVVADGKGKLSCYDPVELVFDPKYNLVDYLISPANIKPSVENEAKMVALKVVEKLNSAGIFAVELFLGKNDEIIVNETAPRAHNSGHQTIEGNYSSQFDQQIRLLLDLPLGSVHAHSSSLMLNLIGAPKYNGIAIYEGLAEILKMEGVFIHLYGKMETRPGRKMGHITLIGDNIESMIEQSRKIKKIINIKA